jgi:hypothetical protein
LVLVIIIIIIFAVPGFFFFEFVPLPLTKKKKDPAQKTLPHSAVSTLFVFWTIFIPQVKSSNPCTTKKKKKLAVDSTLILL